MVSEARDDGLMSEAAPAVIWDELRSLGLTRNAAIDTIRQARTWGFASIPGITGRALLHRGGECFYITRTAGWEEVPGE